MEPAEEALYSSLRERGVSDATLRAMAGAPRALFASPGHRAGAWVDEPLPLPAGQSVSQPLVVARMCDALRLRAGDRVLDVGTGSGWHAAVLAGLAGHVFSIERHRELSERAAESLRAAGAGNVTLAVGDGALGLPEAAPFDAINVAAACRGRVPPALEEQLAEGGRLIAPVDGRLVLVERRGRRRKRRRLDAVSFVPLVSDAG
ncbi:MAG TPA: protein-L-isoaspartate(D-aspartate) O-methyltransferase [Capillimicrobium sp.]